ncbi:hypothetical protein [Xanthobacter autotrophicus]|uniref:hypothetical protein n=1 Tax=Xanthobacter autotrophicus TaxID=280 RepID=UPI00372B7F03
MANFFDQFDEPPLQSRPAQAGGNFFDQFDEPSAQKDIASIVPDGGGPAPSADDMKMRNFREAQRPFTVSGQKRQEPEPWDVMGVPMAPKPDRPPEGGPKDGPSGAWNNLTSRVNDWIYSGAGTPVDMAAGVLNEAGRQVRSRTGVPMPEIVDPLGGKGSITRAFEKIGVLDPATVQAKTVEDRFARGVGEGIGSMVVPAFGVSALGRVGMLSERARETVAPIVGEVNSARSVAANAAVGGAAGGVGSVAGDITAEQAGEKYRPLGEFAGNMLGGVAGAGIAMAPRAVSEASRMGMDYLLPTRASQERATGSVIRDAATDPYAVRDALDEGAAEIIPGSRPTTFQATGDMGLGALERGVATKDQVAFQQRTADQNLARREVLGSIEPGGYPEAVSRTLREQLDSIDQMTAQAVDDATGRAVQGTRALGGDLPPDAYGASLRDIERPIVQNAESEAQAAARAMGGEGRPETYGAELRARLEAAEQAADERTSALWQAIDPDRRINLDATGSRGEARAILTDLPRLAAPLAGDEARIFTDLVNLPDVIPLRELTEVRSQVSKAMREARKVGDDRVLSRMTRVRGALERDIESAVAARAAQEEQAVRAGVMSEEDTMMAMLAKQQQDIRNWYDRRAQTVSMGDSATAGVGGNAPGGSGRISPVVGGQGPARGGFGATPGDQGVQGYRGLPTNLEANADEGFPGRVKEATASTRSDKETFGVPPIKDILRRTYASGPPAVADVAVPGRIIQPGVKGFQNIAAFRQAVGNDEAAMLLLQDAAMADLKSVAMRPNGTMDPRAFERWRDKHIDALRQFPDFHRRVGTAERASRLLDDARIIPEGVLDGDVGGKVFRPGPGGYESVTNFVRAMGDARARTILEDYAINRLRDFAEVKSGDLAGTLDPKKVEMWRARHKDALRALPDVDAKLADPWTASDAIATLAQARKEALDGYQSGVVGRLIGVDDPQDVVNTVGSIFGRQDAVAQMRKLVSETAGNPDARQGLRKAVSDYITKRFISNTEGATSDVDLIRAGQFQSFVKDSRNTLRALFTDPEVEMMSRIADDLHRANRSSTAARIPGQSNTAGDTVAAGRATTGEPQSILSILMKAGAVGAAGGAVGGFLPGVAGAAVIGIAGAMRNAGIKSADTILRDAMLDPKLASVLLEKSMKVTPRQALNLRNALMRASVAPSLSEEPR